MFFGLFSAKTAAQTAYDFSFTTIMGNKPLPLSQFKGKVILIINTASHCGFTKQFAGLEALYKKYKDQGLIIIGVPSNDFGKQDPGTNKKILQFCQVNYGVDFVMTAKEIVVGKNAHPFYQWARKTLGALKAPKWNFHKYLIDRNGHLIDYFFSTTKPESARVIKAIEKALKAS